MLGTKRPHGSLSEHYQFPTNEKARRFHIPTEKVRAQWGNTLNPPRLSDLGESSYLLLGGPRTGKTTLLTLLAKSILITDSSFYKIRYRSLINDPKREWISILDKWGLRRDYHYVVCNAADKRSCCWNIASDLDRPGKIADFVDDLLTLYRSSADSRQEGKSHPFWESIARDALFSIIESLTLRASGNWELRDVVEIATNTHLLEQALNTTAKGRGLWSRVFDASSRDLPGDALATLHMAVEKFRITAALWHRADTYFDIKSWKSKGSLLILGYDSEAVAQSQVTNYLITKAAAQAVSNSAPTKTDLSFFIFDEIATIGRVPKLSQLLDKDHGLGSRIITTALGFHNLESAFEDKSHANEVIGCTDNKAFLRLEHSEDIERACKQLGLEWYEKESTQVPEDLKQITRSYSKEKRFRFDETVLANLKEPGKDGIDAIIQTRGQALPVRTFPPLRPTFEQNISMLGPNYKSGPVEPGFIGRPPEHERLIPFTDEDYRRLGFIREEKVVKTSRNRSTPTAERAEMQPQESSRTIRWTKNNINPFLRKGTK